jgi:hypothetical protein
MHFYSILRLNFKQPFVVVEQSLAKILTKRHSHATLFHQGKRGLIAAKQGCWIGQSSTAEQRLGADVVSLPTFDCSSTQVSHTKDLQQESQDFWLTHRRFRPEASALQSYQRFDHDKAFNDLKAKHESQCHWSFCEAISLTFLLLKID